MTTSDAVARQLKLSWGVVSESARSQPRAPKFSASAILAALESYGLGGKGDRVVITAGLPLGSSGSTNVIRVEELE